jgi:hypothetical protein
MKTLRLTFTVIVFMLLTCPDGWGQTMKQDVLVTMDGYDYGPGIGTVSGTYVYRFTIKLSEEGKIESIHWVVQDCKLHNEFGDKIVCVDTGHDTFRWLWDFWNKPFEGNGYDPRIIYSVNDGWLDGLLPEGTPLEGTCSNLSFKVLYRGTKYTFFAVLVQVHMNANGVITADVMKP